MKTERVQKGIASPISVTLTEDGVATNPTPDAATVTLTRASDATTLGAYDAYDAGTGEFSHVLAPAEIPDLDVLDAAWAVTVDGYTSVFHTTVEVVGGFLFELADARAIKPLDQTNVYTVPKLAEARMLAEQTIEDACARAFVPRYTEETLDGTGGTNLLLSRPDLRRIRKLTVDGTAYSTEQIAGLALRPTGLLYNSAGAFTAGTGNIVVGYEHGTDRPPMRVAQAALLLARSWLVRGPVDDRALGQAGPDGSFSFGLAVPGRNGAWTGVPEVDATIDIYSLRVGVA